VALVNQALADHAQALLDDAAGRGKRAIERVEADLIAFARLLVPQVRLRKALSDPGLPPQPKRALIEELGQGQLDRSSVELLATIASRQRVPPRAFPGLVAELAAMAAFTAAERAGELERVEAELFELATLVNRQPGLRSALTNPGLPVENKRALVADLLGGRASERTATLADLLVELQEGRDLDTSARELAELAARRRNRVVAEVRGVQKSYGEGAQKRVVLAGLNASFATGKLVAVTGPSGSGKTTLLHLLAGIAEADAGDVAVFGRRMADLDREARAALRREHVAVIGQDPGLVPFLSARENVELGLALRESRADEVHERALEALARVGLAERAEQRAARLSAGERQRVAIARAVAAGAGLLLADEPTARLDEANALAVGSLFSRLAREAGVAVVVATHDQLVVEQADVTLRLGDHSRAIASDR